MTDKDRNMLIGLGAVMLLIVLFSATSGTAPQQEDTAAPITPSPAHIAQPLDYTKPVYTTNGAVICDISALDSEDGILNILKARSTILEDPEPKLRALGCVMVRGSVPLINPRPAADMPHVVLAGTSSFTFMSDVTNDRQEPHNERVARLVRLSAN
jgi:hypothetical protein